MENNSKTGSTPPKKRKTRCKKIYLDCYQNKGDNKHLKVKKGNSEMTLENKIKSIIKLNFSTHVNIFENLEE